MKSFTISAILSIAALSSCASAAIKIGIAKPSHSTTKKRLSRRANILEQLQNNITGASYMATVTVGTPPQDISLAIDTGSSDTWVLDSGADLCTDKQYQAEEMTGCQTPFNSGDSKTFKIQKADAFHITYGDQSGADGDYFTDDFTIGDASISDLWMGIAHSANLTQGLLGIGYSVNEASNSDNPYTERVEGFIYPNIIDAMVDQKLIATNAYSLYLDDLTSETGSIIFGGLDTDKFHGDLVQMPIVPRIAANGSDVFREFAVALTSLSVTGGSSDNDLLPSGSPPPVVLDSGTFLTYLPSSLTSEIYQQVNAYDDTANQPPLGTGLALVDCALIKNNPDMSFDFGFGGTDGSKNITIKVPANEMILDPSDLSSDSEIPTSYLPRGYDFSSVCFLGIIPSDDEPFILGDTFLRSAYVVYDLKNNVIGLAQTNFDSTSSSILDFEADEEAIPAVSGVASSAGITETATGKVGDKTNSATATGQPTATGGSDGTQSGATVTVTKSPGAAVALVPAFDASGLLVLGGSALFALLGGGWFLA